MIVYVETNFIFELALRREQVEACEQMLARCASGPLDLRLPAYALAEARSAFRRRERERTNVATALKAQARQLVGVASRVPASAPTTAISCTPTKPRFAAGGLK